MAKITRKTAKIFASNAGASGVSEFGSIAGGSVNYSKDLDVLQSSDYEAGWLNAILAGPKKIPPYEEMNAVQLVLSQQIAYGLQEGIAEYDSGTEYHQYSIVKKTGSYELYGSKINTNAGNALPSAVDDSNWSYLGDLSDLVDAGQSTIVSFNEQFSAALSATATTSFADTGLTAITFTPASATNLILINYSIGGEVNTDNKPIIAAINIDASTEVYGQSGMDTGSTANVDFLRGSGLLIKQLSAVSHTIKLYFRSESTGTATVNNASLQIIEIQN